MFAEHFHRYNSVTKDTVMAKIDHFSFLRLINSSAAQEKWASHILSILEKCENMTLPEKNHDLACTFSEFDVFLGFFQTLRSISLQTLHTLSSCMSQKQILQTAMADSNKKASGVGDQYNYIGRFLTQKCRQSFLVQGQRAV